MSKVQQTILAPDEEWITYIAKMWLLGSEVSQQVLGEEMDGTEEDLRRLQSILNTGTLHPNQTQQLQALGIVFGKVFVNLTPDYDWWVVEDEYGKDACVRYKQTTLLAFPQTMISKRIEDGEDVNVSELFSGLRERLETLRKDGYAGV